MEIITILFFILLALSGGAVLGYFTRQTIASKQINTAEAKMVKIMNEAKDKAKEMLLSAKDKSVKILEESKKQEQERHGQLVRMEERLEKKDENLEKKSGELERNQNNLLQKAQEIKNIKEEVEQVKTEQSEKLQKIAKLSYEEAKDLLLKMSEEKYKEELVQKIRRMEEEESDELDKKACDLMVLAMQKYASSQAVESTTSVVSLPSDELKGRIIGREGRNIKTLEKATGAEIIIDDTPEAIVVSSFDPARRQVAKMALEKLISDGRIHPARIEDMIKEAKEKVASKIKEAGEAACYDVGVAGLPPKLIQILGRLTFRTSYGQNVLIHSIEVAHLAGALASELGADVALVKKAGLLHDIGKSVSHQVEGGHVDIGISILQKFGISEEVIKAMRPHHEEYPFESNEAIIIAVADALSASRPGARKDNLENYLKRLKELEKIADSFDEVNKSYAIQGGREIRIFVKPEKIDDLGAIKLSRKIADKIEQDLEYPGEIKIHVIRETRTVEYAR